MPSSATTNGTRVAMRPDMKATSRERRSSLAMQTDAPALRAALRAAASCGRRRAHRLPLPVSISVYSATISRPSALAKACDGGALRLQAKAGAALPLSGDAIVGDEAFVHRLRNMLTSVYMLQSVPNCQLDGRLVALVVTT